MNITDLQKKDYYQLVEHAKNIVNYNDIFVYYNETLHTQLATHWLNSILLYVNYAKVIRYNGLIVGVILAHIPNYELKAIFHETDLKKFNSYEYSDIESFIAYDENQLEIKNLEILTNETYESMVKKHQELLSERAEILMFSVLPKHQGRGLSNILLNRFKYDIIEYNCPEFFLFTTSLCNFSFYEYKKFAYIKEAMLDIGNVNETQVEYFPLPLYGIIYYYDARFPNNYDPIADEISNQEVEM